MLTAPPRDADVSLPNTNQLAPRSPGAEKSSQDVLQWTVHLLRGRTHRLPWIGLSVVLVVAGGLFVFGNPLLALLPALALILSLSDFLFPIRYTLSPKGAQVRQGLMSLEIAWENVRHAYHTEEGIKLSPLKHQATHLEPLRGVYVRFAGNEQVVIAAVRRYRARAAVDA